MWGVGEQQLNSDNGPFETRQWITSDPTHPYQKEKFPCV